MQGWLQQNPRESRLRNNLWAVDAHLIPRVLRPTLVPWWLMERMTEKEGKSIVNVVGCDPGEGNTVDGVQNHVCEVFVCVIRKTMPFAKLKTALVVGSRGAVVGGGSYCEVRQSWMALETFHRSSR